MLWHLDSPLKEIVDWKNNTSIWFCCSKKEEQFDGRLKEWQDAEGAPHLLEPKKAY